MRPGQYEAIFQSIVHGARPREDLHPKRILRYASETSCCDEARVRLGIQQQSHKREVCLEA